MILLRYFKALCVNIYLRSVNTYLKTRHRIRCHILKLRCLLLKRRLELEELWNDPENSREETIFDFSVAFTILFILQLALLKLSLLFWDKVWTLLPWMQIIRRF